MKTFIKVIKIVLGIAFGLSAISMLSFLPYVGIDYHFGIAVVQGLIAFFLLASAFKRKGPPADAGKAGPLISGVSSELQEANMRRLNRNQKYIIYAAALIFISIIFVHNPTHGYANMDHAIAGTDVQFPFSEKRCYTANHLQKVQGISHPVLIYCLHRNPFMQWESRGALISWFKTPLNVLWSLLFLAVATVVSLFATGIKAKSDSK